MASPSPAPARGSQTFTEMTRGDVEAIGAQCQMAYCGRLDFLPFRCESCRGKFCLDHRTESSHSCTKAGAWARARREATPSYHPTQKPSLFTHDQQCSLPACKTLINTPRAPGVHCTTCNRHYCLKHRMGEEHDCKKLIPLGARPSGERTMKEKGVSALSKFREWGQNKKAAAANSSLPLFSNPSLRKFSTKTTSTVAENNKLKQTARGEGSIPPEKRIYLHVEASADTTKAKHPTGKFFYNKEWSVGRVLDAAAKALQVENVNNRGGGEEEKLRVFHVEAGRLLEFSEKIGTVCQTGNTIVLLRGVGPPVPDLIEA